MIVRVSTLCEFCFLSVVFLSISLYLSITILAALFHRVLTLNSLPILRCELCVSSIFLMFFLFFFLFFLLVCDWSRETLTTIQRDTQTLTSIAFVSVRKRKNQNVLTIDSDRTKTVSDAF